MGKINKQKNMMVLDDNADSILVPVEMSEEYLLKQLEEKEKGESLIKEIKELVLEYIKCGGFSTGDYQGILEAIEIKRNVDYEKLHNLFQKELKKAELEINNFEKMCNFIENNPDEEISSVYGSVFGDINSIKENINCDLTKADVDARIKYLKNLAKKELNVNISLEFLNKHFDSYSTDYKNLEKDQENLMEKSNSLNDRVKDWYCTQFPDDSIGSDLNPDTTFNDAMNSLGSSGLDIYNVLGGYADSIVRERVFKRLSEITGKSYDFFYNKWLSKESSVEIEEQIEKD